LSEKGIQYLREFEPRKALPLLKRAALKEKTYGALINYGAAQRGCSLIHEAQETLLEALAIDQTRPEAWSNLGQCAEDLGQFTDAPGYFLRALQCIEKNGTPLHSAGEPLLAFAYSMMRLGNFKYVWPVWEACRINRSWAPFPVLHPWKGEKGAKLLVVAEGGFGDAFNFLRWLPRLPLATATVLAWDGMFEIIKATLDPLGIRVLPLSHKFQYDELAEYTHCAPYLSLMTGFEQWSEIPPPLQWLPRGRIVAPPNDWIGFCWHAEEGGYARRFRSLDKPAADQIGKYLSGKAERVVSLCPQGKHLYRKADLSVPKGVTQDDQLLADWEATARTILKCRMVVTVDTAVYHLSASLGVPTLILNPLRSDWKHQLPPLTTTSFYGSNVKQFRNTHPTRWEVSKIIEAIDSL
jgi:tetratricopeptide (TPR) repeat protein